MPLPSGVHLRQAEAADAAAIHALMRPFVMQRLLLARTEAEVIELTRHGFVAVLGDSGQSVDSGKPINSGQSVDLGKLVGFAAIEVYSQKLAELQCLAVAKPFQGSGIGRALVARCVQRARNLNIMEVLAISSSESFLQSCGFDYALPDQKKALFCQLRPRPIE